MAFLPEEALERAAAAHGCLSRAELLRLPGVTRHTVDRWVKAGTLIPEWRGHYRLAGSAVTRRQQLLLAVERAGGVAADESALALRRADGFPLQPPFAVALPTSSRVRDPALRLIRVDLDPEDVTTCAEIPAMTAERALIGVSDRVGRARLRAAYDDLRRRRLLEPQRLLDRARAFDATAVLEIAEQGDLRMESEGERRLDRIWRPDDPRPEPQVWVHHAGRHYRLDFVFLDSRLAPEYDGRAAHAGDSNRHRDAQRALALAALQIQRLSVTAPMLQDPEDLRVRILTVHEQRLRLDLEPLVPAAPPAWFRG